MPLSPEARLGSYEVLALLGKGGMGEVYRALDHKLGREVALKLLPEDFSHEGDRLLRFEREARILASLNHPNVATLHGLEESGGRHFLIMELVPGETLAERISRGRVPLDEAIALFKQIAEALEAAHEKGVIHRDLKPSNIKITPEGNVRVLDFGLAKVFEDASASGDLSHSPTLTREGTRMGMVMGTAAYMSPEQTRGKRLDRRSDMWAFGCCLFEALSGSKAFDGETVTDVFAAIVRGEPDWSRLPKDVPAPVEVLLRRCLTRDLAYRMRDAGDARIELEDALKRPAPFAPPESKSSRRILYAVGLGLSLLALGIGIGSRLPRDVEPVKPVKRLEVNLPEGLTLGELEWPVAALSPDGTRLALVARSRSGRDKLYLRSLADGTTVPIQGTDGASSPFFSPDGEWIGFAAGTFLKKVSVRGGAPVPICSAFVDFGAAWGEDDTIVFRTNALGLQRVPSSGGEPRRFTNESHRWPTFLPDGKTLLVEHDGGVSVVALDTGETHRVIDAGRTPRYVRSGYLLYEYERTFYAAAFDLEALLVRGMPIPLGESVRRTMVGPAHYDVAKDGSLIYLPEASSSAAEKSLVWVERNGVFGPVTESRRAFAVPRLSPDGRRIAVAINEGPSLADIWIHDLGRDALRRATVGGGGFSPFWSPDGRRLTYSARRNDTWYLLQSDADGGGAPEELLENGDRFLVVDSWSPDGRMLLYSSPVPDRGEDEFLFTAEDGSSRTFVSSPEYDSEGAFSPDGKWVVYTSAESGVLQLYVQALAVPGKRWQISEESGRDPVWTSGGKEIIFRSGRRILSVAVRTEADFEAAVPEILFEGPFELETSGFRNFDVTRDGQRFVMIHEDQGPLDRLVFVVNWADEHERLVPTN